VTTCGILTCAARALATLFVVMMFGACGQTVSPRADAPKPRVVSLAPALTAIVKAVGGMAHLVGVTSYCDAPGVPVVGDFSPRPEAVLAQRPDLVLMAGYETQATTASALVGLGLAVKTLPLVTLAQMRATTREVGRLLGREAAADAALGELDRALALAKPAVSPSAAVTGKPTSDTVIVNVLLVYDVQPGFVITTGGGDHLSELVALLGGKNLIVGPVTARVGLERVLEGAPDLILHVAPDTRFPASAAASRYWSGWPGLPAVARGQVVVYPDDGLARNGPHLAQVVPRLAAILVAARAAMAKAAAAPTGHGVTP